MRGEFDGKEYQRNIKRADEKPGLKKICNHRKK